MLETIREFASEVLKDSSEAEEVRRRHAERMLELARSAHLRSEDVGEGAQQMDRVLAELDDVRGALEWALGADIALAVELFTRLEALLVTTAPPERLRWAHALLAHEASLPPELRARLLRTGGAILILSGEPEPGEERCEQALALFRELGDDYSAVEMQARFVVYSAPRRDLTRFAASSRRCVCSTRPSGTRTSSHRCSRPSRTSPRARMTSRRLGRSTGSRSTPPRPPGFSTGNSGS